jgi:hypothetical protein
MRSATRSHPVERSSKRLRSSDWNWERAFVGAHGGRRGGGWRDSGREAGQRADARPRPPQASALALGGQRGCQTGVEVELSAQLLLR